MKLLRPELVIVGLLFFALAEGSSAQDADLATSFEALNDLPGGITISTQFESPDQVPGIAGKAWRTDGFSSFASVPLDLSGTNGFTVSTWIALESYPSDLEVVVSRLSPSSILHQREGSKGFDIFIDTYGRWGLLLATSRGDVRINAPDSFPLYSWAHIAASVDTTGRHAALYLDGRPVASAKLKIDTSIDFADTPLELARSDKEVGYLNFTFNYLNAAYDELAVYRRALNAEEIEALVAATGERPDGEASLIVPASRFANDHLRPRFRGMPPANWTNEPHGLVRRGNTWHLFYQRTPNGPYKTQMHWGHMASDDLVTWRHLPDALWPELQDDNFGFDQKGIWSGDVIIDGDTAFAFYTSVNHFHRLRASNPGVSMAISRDAELRNWEKVGPVVNTKHVNDFRDPYLWREGHTWHMIIGAAIDTGGGLDYYVLEPGENGANWEHRDRFSAVSYRLLDIGSIIWEMPVFEPLSDDVHVLVVNPIGGRVSKYGDPATRGVYWMGDWKEGLFHPFDREPKMLDILPGHLAPTVARAEDGQLRAIGIVDERRTPQSQEDAGWAHTYSLPRSWRLLPDQHTLGQAPAPELRKLRGEQTIHANAQQLGTDALLLREDSHAYELEITLGVSSADAILGLDLLASPGGEEVTRLDFDLASDEITLDLGKSTTSGEREGPDEVSGSYDRTGFGKPETLRVFVDGSVIDVFINDAAAFSFRSYPRRKDSTGVQVAARNGSVNAVSIRSWTLTKPQ